MNKNTLSFFTAYVSLILICFINIAVLVSPVSAINGEIVYTCGFFLVLYAIWVETNNNLNEALKSQFNFSQISLFWYKYKELERSLFFLINAKIKLIEDVLALFLLTSVFLKTLNCVTFKVFKYKILIQLLNKIKLKTKALPLQ
jgi:hypothetical protein